MKKNILSTLLIVLSMGVLHAQERGGCLPPDTPQVSGIDEVCFGEMVTLSATSDGDQIAWFDAEVDGTLLGIGNTYETGALEETTTFWAEARNFITGDLETGGARVAPSSNSSGSVNPGTAPWGLVFNADESFILNSVTVFLAGAGTGTLTVQLKDSDLNIVDEVTVATPAGNSGTPVPFEVDLDFDIPTGNGWRLVASESPTMVREFSSGHPGFPYPIGTVGSVVEGTINDSNTNSALYYFFYDWSYTPNDVCASDRESITVDVLETPLPEGESVQGFDPGDTLADFEITGENLTWYQDADGILEIPDSTPIVEGVPYYVSQTLNDCESELFQVMGQLNLGIQDENFAGFAYYPNPVSEVLHISNNVTIDSVTLYTISGQLIRNFTVSLNETTLELSDLPKGIYMLQVTAEGQSKTVNIIKK